MTLHRLLYEWTFYVLTTIGTQRPRQTKELVWRLQLPEALRFNVSYLHSSAELHFSASTATHNPSSDKPTSKKKQKTKTHTHTQAVPSVSADSHTDRPLKSWRRLPSSRDTERACCLFCFLLCFVSIGTLRNRGEGRRRTERPESGCQHPLCSPDFYSTSSPSSFKCAAVCFHNLCKQQVELPTVHSQAALVCHNSSGFTCVPCLCERLLVSVLTTTTTTTLHSLVTHCTSPAAKLLHNGWTESHKVCDAHELCTEPLTQIDIVYTEEEEWCCFCVA